MPHKDPVARKAYAKAHRAANQERLTALGKAWYEANKGRKETARKAWNEANKERRAATAKLWREANKEREAATHKTWYDANKDHVSDIGKAYHAAHPEKSRVKSAHRRALKSRACPAWVDRAALTAIYEGCPEGYHVDHIHPLKGKNSTGLHVPWNLNYLPDEENLSKSNHQPQPGYLDWFSEAWTIHAPPTGRVWTPTDYDNI
jgi:hypothetical protein